LAASLCHLIKEMAEGVRDGKISFFFDVQRSETVCEQSASVLASRRRVHQFVNKVHQIVTVGTLPNGFLGNKKCVVEHKAGQAVCFWCRSH
jgi:hypothetical protein